MSGRIVARGRKYVGEGKDRRMCRHPIEKVILEEESVGWATHRAWRTTWNTLQVSHHLHTPDLTGRIRLHCTGCGRVELYADAKALPPRFRQLLKELLELDDGRVFEPDPRQLTMSAGVVVLPIWDSLVCLSQRTKAGNFHGYWQGPGGKLEDDDWTPRDGAARELEEETGLQAYAPSLELIACDVATKPSGEKYHLWVYAWDLLRANPFLKEPPKLLQTEPDKQGPWQWFHRFELPSPLMPLYREGLSKFYRFGGMLPELER